MPSYEELLARAYVLRNPYWSSYQREKAHLVAIQQRGAPQFPDERRIDYVRRFAWAIPNPAALARVAYALGPQAIEIGAGTGYWAHLLTQLGVDMLCIDDAPDDREAYISGDGHLRGRRHYHYHPVQIGRAANYGGRYPERSLFLCWPPMDPMAASALRTYTKAGGQTVVYIGESLFGCTADRAFHTYLQRDWEPEAWTGPHGTRTSYPIEQWHIPIMWMSDAIYIYHRKGA